jgi:hypothetical protein
MEMNLLAMFRDPPPYLPWLVVPGVLIAGTMLLRMWRAGRMTSGAERGRLGLFD